MKTVITAASCVLLSLTALTSFSQEKKIPINEPDYGKPRLFSDLPQKMSMDVVSLEPLFRLTVGNSVSVQLTNEFILQGVVVSTSDINDAALKSVVVRSTNRQGAIFTFTKTTRPDGSFAYIGRMMSRNNGDAYEMALENGTYVLQKKNLYDLISE
jgi:hypothetical protein